MTRAFDTAELRRFVASIDEKLQDSIIEGSTSRSELSSLSVGALKRRNLLDLRFFELLRAERPNLAEDVARVRALWIRPQVHTPDRIPDRPRGTIVGMFALSLFLQPAAPTPEGKVRTSPREAHDEAIRPDPIETIELNAGVADAVLVRVPIASLNAEYKVLVPRIMTARDAARKMVVIIFHGNDLSRFRPYERNIYTLCLSDNNCLKDDDLIGRNLKDGAEISIWSTPHISMGHIMVSHWLFKGGCDSAPVNPIESIPFDSLEQHLRTIPNDRACKANEDCPNGQVCTGNEAKSGVCMTL